MLIGCLNTGQIVFYLVTFSDRNSFTLPGESFVSILPVLAGFNELILTLKLLCCVTILSLKMHLSEKYYHKHHHHHLHFLTLPLLHRPALLPLHVLAVLVSHRVTLLTFLRCAPDY